MAKVKVSAVDVLETLRTVVAERPDYVYAAPADQDDTRASCFYVHGAGEDAQPGCLVGHVLYRHGVSLDDLAAHEGAGAHDVTTALVDLMGEPDAVRETLGALLEAQGQQDDGATWGEALAEATRADGE
jgi:hypothetical protein